MARWYRSFFDRTVFRLRAERGLLVASVVGIAGLATTVLASVNDIRLLMGVVGLVLIVAPVLYAVILSVARWSSIRVVQSGNGVDSNDQGRHAPGMRVIGLKQTVLLTHGSAARDPDLDSRLDQMKERVSWRDDTYEPPRAISSIGPYVLATVARKQHPWNDNAVRMESDLPAAEPHVPTDVSLRPVKYYSILTTNHLVAYSVHRRGRNWPFLESYVLDSEGRFPALADSQLANGIGVSTIAVTLDNAIVIVRQSADNGSSRGLWAPSGSGSLEPSDVQHARTHLLREPLISRAELELHEEAGIPLDRILGTKLVGFARWIEKGGSPEFFAVTALNITRSDFGLHPRAHQFWKRERRHASAIWVLERRTDEHFADLRKHAAMSDGTALPAISVPLELNLQALDAALARDPRLLEDMRANAKPGRPLPAAPIAKL